MMEVIRMTKQYTLLCLVFLFYSLSTPSFASNTTVYPPSNEAAGGGLLYFPAGGDSSLFAAPVISDDLTAAVKAQTEVLKEIKDAISKSSGGVQCETLSGGQGALTICINTLTGKICSLDDARWVCYSVAGWSP